MSLKSYFFSPDLFATGGLGIQVAGVAKLTRVAGSNFEPSSFESAAESWSRLPLSLRPSQLTAFVFADQLKSVLSGRTRYSLLSLSPSALSRTEVSYES